MRGRPGGEGLAGAVGHEGRFLGMGLEGGPCALKGVQSLRMEGRGDPRGY